MAGVQQTTISFAEKKFNVDTHMLRKILPILSPKSKPCEFFINDINEIDNYLQPWIDKDISELFHVLNNKIPEKCRVSVIDSLKDILKKFI